MRDQLATTINDQLKTVTANLTESNERMLDSVVDVSRKVVDFAVKTADRVADQAPTLPIDVPFADRLPTPAQAGERYLDIVERLVEMNRDFNERVVSMLPADVKPAAKTVTSAPKTAAKKAPAKKTTARKTTAKKTTAKKTTAKK